MAISMPNAILENTNIYRFRDLVEVQKQSKITNFSVQINDKSILGCITHLRLLQLQHSEWLQHNPLYEWPYSSVQRRHYKSFLASMISLCKETNISFNVPFNLRNTILEGSDTIRSILSSSDFFKYRAQLIKHNIMFIDQLTTINGQFLSIWHTITHRSFTQHRQVSKIPQWFRLIEQHLLLTNDGSRFIKPQYVQSASHFKGMQVLSPSFNNRAKDWIGVWAPSVSQPVLGRILVKNQSTSIATIQHWIVNSLLSTTDRSIIQPCTGCVINESVSPNICSFVAPAALSVLLGRTTKVDSSTRQLHIPLFELFQIISYHYNFSRNNLPFVIPTFTPISLP